MPTPPQGRPPPVTLTGMSENVGKLSLRTERRSAMIRAMDAHSSQRNVVVVAYEGVQSLDVTGPLEVFTGARAVLAARGIHDGGHVVRTVAGDGSPLRTSSGLTLVPDGGLRAARA